jgi:hypothetical protein
MTSRDSAFEDAADDALASPFGKIHVLIGVAVGLRKSGAHMSGTCAVILAGLGNAVTLFSRGIIGGQDRSRAQCKEAANRGREHDRFRIHLGLLKNRLIALRCIKPLAHTVGRESKKQQACHLIKAVDNQLLIASVAIHLGKLRFITLTLGVRSGAIAVYRDSAVARRAW